MGWIVPEICSSITQSRKKQPCWIVGEGTDLRHTTSGAEKYEDVEGGLAPCISAVPGGLLRGW
jgi:hypothetical protein